MKKTFLLLAAGAIILVSCKGHGQLCPAYSAVKKAQNVETASVHKTAKGISS